MKIKYFKKLSEDAKIKIVIKVNDYSLDEVHKILNIVKEAIECGKENGRFKGNK